MLHYEEDEVRALIPHGEIGLEKENLRVTEDGYLARTPDPFAGDPHIVKDFAECQVEINTDPWPDSAGAIRELGKHTARVRSRILENEKPEYLWPFSNPPYLTSPEDVPIAQYTGGDAGKTEYRKYLAGKYGTYLMTFSGIHLNFSFPEALLRADFRYSGEDDFRKYKDGVYLNLAQQLLRYGWVMNILTAASPLLDGSYFANERLGEDAPTGYASVRCSEKGYWNPFVPVMDYSSTDAYVDSIAAYVNDGSLRAPSELYFPIRLKAGNRYTLEHLRTGWTHIELRSIDLNPFVPEGLDPRDVDFAQLLMFYLASCKDEPLSREEKVRGVDNFKRAARLYPEWESVMLDARTEATMADAAMALLWDMQDFYRFAGSREHDILSFEMDKLEHPDHRYAFRVLEKFSGGYVRKGVEYMKTLK